jgi:hypothetical protein
VGPHLQAPLRDVLPDALEVLSAHKASRAVVEQGLILLQYLCTGDENKVTSCVVAIEL